MILAVCSPVSLGWTKTLIVGADLAYPPYEYTSEKGQPAGFNIDMIRAVATIMGLEITIQSGVWSDIRRDMDAGRIDIQSGLFYSKERDKKLDFSTPFIKLSYSLFVKKSSGIKTLENVRGKRIIVLKNDFGHNFVAKHDLTDHVITATTLSDIFTLIGQGEGDGAVLSRLQGLDYIYSHQVRDIEVVGAPFKPKKYCFAVGEGNTDLLAVLNEGLILVNRNGTYDSIYNKWFGPREQKSLLKRLLQIFMWGLLPMGALLAGSLYWSWALNRKIQLRTMDLQTERDYSAGIINNAQTMICGISPKGKTTFINPAVRKITGYGIEQVIGKDWWKTIHPSDFSPEVEELIRRFGKQENFMDFEMKMTTPQNTRKSISWSGFTIYDPAGNPEEIICFGNDITQIKRVQEELLESKRKLSVLINNLPGMTYRSLNDRERTMEFVSKGCVALTGYTVTDFVFGNKIDYNDLIHPDDRDEVRKKIAQTLLLKKAFQIEYRIQTGLNQEKWVEENGIGIVSDLNRVISIEGFITDITDRKLGEIKQTALEAQLQQSQKMEALGALSSGIAHDFNNILGVIIGYSQIMTMFDKVEDERFKKRVEQILKASHRGRDLVQQILAFSRKADGKHQTVWLKSLVEEALTFLKASLPPTVIIKKRIKANNAAVFADPSQIYQIIMNLCTNAIQAMGEGGGVLSAGVEFLEDIDENLVQVYNLDPGRYVCITIRDTGPGISPEIQKKMFEPFFTTKKVGEGTGMGLAVVHGIVKNLGGCIQVISSPDNGCKFEILIPAYDSKKNFPDAQEAMNLPTGEGHVLVVDDEPDLVIVTTEILEALGYTVTGCTDSKKALGLFSRYPFRFDLVLTDQIMPDITGIQLTGKMLELRSDTPVVLCSGMSRTVNEEGAKKAGAKAFLKKPLSPYDLSHTLARLLDPEGLKLK